MARARDDEYDDEDDAPAPRRRRDRDDDDYDRPVERGPLDGMYANTSIVVLVLFGLCCGLIAFVLSLVAYLTAKDPKAKSNAGVVLVVSGILMVVGIILQVGGFMAGLGGAGAPGGGGR